MKRFVFGYVAGALSLFLGLAYWHSYQSAKAMKQVRTWLQGQTRWIHYWQEGEE